ncbi:acetylglutamate kinase [Megasphaera sp. ASD88]|uniref:acetylglutamate kinase n=1 Tax=Megasphaera TaxID=906 RepID=UPI000B3BB748|nr:MULTISPECIES: acetylglutamate kinase [Megasphaera]NJE34741.1 acetylglutamate kinase [Megasphaera sp. SW808]MBM6733350.1 acetylglutamate kinase [Megasphaera stantonii]MCU6715420.1 acetylglutamate kinase [Megasphaera butyrica]OUO47176.1 acetylglutamate kinase [Megasphaera sp. An286]PAV38787.1 acetylglutamate kinase [Megasphaera sp. ASD88]
MQSVTNAQKAQILMNALPYIKKYSGKIVVVKYGGNAMVNESLKRAVMGDIVLLNLIGIKVVLVHGGGPHIKEVLDRVGIESKFIDGLRVTDAETMKIVQMVLAGQVNKDLVSLIGSMGGNAIGLCGLDDRMIRVRKQSDDLGFVGKITSLDVEIIQDNLDKGYIPVIATIGTDKNGQAYNINADTAAAEIAGALNAECMVSMTNIDGVLRDKDDPSSLITDLTLAQADQLKKEGVIAGGMIPKVQCCIDAIQAGVKKVFIVNGMVPHAILIELLTEEGLGTMFVNKYSEGR